MENAIPNHNEISHWQKYKVRQCQVLVSMQSERNSELLLIQSLWKDFSITPYRSNTLNLIIYR